jgi:hypothetical protein
MSSYIARLSSYIARLSSYILRGVVMIFLLLGTSAIAMLGFCSCRLSLSPAAHIRLCAGSRSCTLRLSSCGFRLSSYNFRLSSYIARLSSYICRLTSYTHMGAVMIFLFLRTSTTAMLSSCSCRLSLSPAAHIRLCAGSRSCTLRLSSYSFRLSSCSLRLSSCACSTGSAGQLSHAHTASTALPCWSLG